MVDLILPLPGLSPVAGKGAVARFDGGRLSSEGGLLVLREIERRLSVDRLAACIDDPRDPGGTVHTLSDIVRFRLLMIAVGLRRRQRRARPAQRSAVQDGARPGVVGAGLVFAVDHLPAGEPAREANAAAPGPGAGRSLLRLVPAGAAAHHPRHRRYLRCGARRPAVASLGSARNVRPRLWSWRPV